MKKLFKNKYLVAFFLSFCLGLSIVLPVMVINKGIFSLVADYNLQQVPFGMLINHAVKEGSFFWTWFNDLGSNFIGTFSFYNLFSPFSIISYLFPSNFYPYLCGPLLVLKYGIAGLTSYLFLKRYVKNKNYAIVGSLLYSFSGFQLTNMLFHFHDVVALFPLLLYTLDNLIYDNKKCWFLLVVTLMSLTNWYFFVGEVIFVILYFLVKVCLKEYKITWNNFGIIVLESILGTMISGFVLLPTFLFVLSNPRLSSSWSLISMIKYPNFGTYVELLRSFVFPPDTMVYRAFLTDHNYNSVEMFLPVVGVVFVVAYFMKNYKKWDSILFIICLIFMSIPILNSSFFLFNGIYYARWFYMPILIMVLMTIKCFENKNININKAFIVNILLYFTLGIGIIIYIGIAKTTGIIFDKKYFLFFVVVSITCLIGSYFMYKIKNLNKRILFFIISIFIYVAIWGNYMVYTYRGDNFGIDQQYLDYLNINKYISLDEDVRTNSTSSCLANFGVVGSFNNIKSFNSNINGSSFEFYNSIGIRRTVATDIDNKLLNDFLGVKYIVSCGEKLEDYEFINNVGPYELYLNDDYKNIGFIVSEYISLDEFNNLSYDERISKLNEAVVLNEEQIEKYDYLFGEKIDYEIENFNFDNNSFSSNINISSDSLIVFTVPYDKGWRAFVDGEEVEVEKVDNGFMAIKVLEGENKITFLYKVPGLKYGMFLSIFGIIFYICYYEYLKKCN